MMFNCTDVFKICNLGNFEVIKKTFNKSNEKLLLITLGQKDLCKVFKYLFSLIPYFVILFGKPLQSMTVPKRLCLPDMHSCIPLLLFQEGRIQQALGEKSNNSNLRVEFLMWNKDITEIGFKTNILSASLAVSHLPVGAEKLLPCQYKQGMLIYHLSLKWNKYPLLTKLIQNVKEYIRADCDSCQ